MGPILKMGGAPGRGSVSRKFIRGTPWKFDRVNTWTSIAQTTVAPTLLAR